MQKLLSIFVTACWALWFGGLATLFMVAWSLFDTFEDNNVAAGLAARNIFYLFERYQLTLAVVIILSLLASRVLQQSRLHQTFFLLTLLATVAATLSATLITPQIDEMRDQMLTATPEFHSLHGWSVCAFLSEATLLSIAGVVWVLALCVHCDE